ncbi:MAG TPA: hypothetical protein ENG75_07125 [Nitrospirae bacterium]|nr:hypothetical protein [Nitrospirota bacterium]HDK17697.1 hypothetical protein [Nitrospirota bacterium]
MEEETGTVTEVYGNTAKVLTQKKSSCEGCGVQGACQPAAEGKDSRRASLAGMTNNCSLYTDSI